MNRLAHEKSPYLLQHAKNPVDWFPWGEEAFAKARAENKPIFLSIGYSTCYWCHVMEKDSFEVESVAEVLNQFFVPVKVDREEHPDVDEIYMNAVIAMTGHGGWPMSVFLKPDLKPFWGGTYLPRAHFMQLMGRIAEVWKESPNEIERGSQKLFSVLEAEENEGLRGSGKKTSEIFSLLSSQAQDRFDSLNGGFGGAPKFPASMTLRALLSLQRLKHIPDLAKIIDFSLEKMACGGIYDHLGGGFHRYSTDEAWLVPHFEKMLYDNALLATTYLEAYQSTGKKIYLDVASETLDYLRRDMRSHEGAFFAAEDAGEVGAEGEFYVWKEEELKKILGPHYSKFSSVFPLSQSGNFENSTNILHLNSAADWDASRTEILKELRAQIFEVRKKRNAPHKDEKILTAWNGLALRAFSLGAIVAGNKEYLETAVLAAECMKTHLWDGNKLFRRYCAGEAKYEGTSSDYAFLIEGLLALYQATFEEKWLLWARELQGVLDKDFWDEKEGGYFTAAHHEKDLIIRKKDRSDGAIPSPNSVSYRNLLLFSVYFHDFAFERKAQLLREFLNPQLERIPMGLAEAIQGVFLAGVGITELVFSGPDEQCKKFIQALRERFYPEIVLVKATAQSLLPAAEGKSSEEEFVGYVCHRGTCYAPKNLIETLDYLAGMRPQLEK